MFPNNLLQQTLTYWSPSANPDQFGFRSFSAPVTLDGRKEEKNVIFIDSDGREQVAESVYWTESDVQVQGYLFLGSSTVSDPTSVSGAKEIRAIQKIPSLRADKFLRKALV